MEEEDKVQRKKEKTIEDDTWGPYVTVANGVKCRSIPSLRIPPTKQKTGFDPTLQPNTNWVQPNPKIWVGLNPSPIQTHANIVTNYHSCLMIMINDVLN